MSCIQGLRDKIGFGFDVWIYWTLMYLVTIVHKSLPYTLSSSSDRTPHGNYSDFQLNCRLLLASHYMALGWTTAQKTHPLPSNGYMRSHRERPVLLWACIAGIVYKWVCSVGCIFVAGLFTELFPSNGFPCHIMFVTVWDIAFTCIGFAPV
jgi:hypothetical protein